MWRDGKWKNKFGKETPLDADSSFRRFLEQTKLFLNIKLRYALLVCKFFSIINAIHFSQIYKIKSPKAVVYREESKKLIGETLIKTLL